MTYDKIIEDFEKETNCICKSCWIAERKNALGFITKPAANRGSKYLKHRCPQQYHNVLDKLIRHYYG